MQSGGSDDALQSSPGKILNLVDAIIWNIMKRFRYAN